ncbi:MAG: hypothetical protein DI547_04975 [Sphingobium sp.]|nr:MAG: hypothetical protein DI547_04975 [Sphingobium sp.]
MQAMPQGFPFLHGGGAKRLPSQDANDIAKAAPAMSPMIFIPTSGSIFAVVTRIDAFTQSSVS